MKLNSEQVGKICEFYDIQEQELINLSKKDIFSALCYNESYINFCTVQKLVKAVYDIDLNCL